MDNLQSSDAAPFLGVNFLIRPPLKADRRHRRAQDRYN